MRAKDGVHEPKLHIREQSCDERKEPNAPGFSLEEQNVSSQ